MRAEENQLTSMLVTTSLGLMLGSWASGVWGWFLWFTRSQRRARNLLVIALGFVVVGVPTLGSLWVFIAALELMGIESKAHRGDVALSAFTVGFASVSILTLWNEIKWRRSVGL